MSATTSLAGERSRLIFHRGSGLALAIHPVLFGVVGCEFVVGALKHATQLGVYPYLIGVAGLPTFARQQFIKVCGRHMGRLDGKTRPGAYKNRNSVRRCLIRHGYEAVAHGVRRLGFLCGGIWTRLATRLFWMGADRGREAGDGRCEARSGDEGVPAYWRARGAVHAEREQTGSYGVFFPRPDWRLWGVHYVAGAQHASAERRG